MYKYIPDNFSLHELVDPKTYKKYGQIAWQFFDSRILWTLDAIRDEWNTGIIVNNWGFNKKNIIGKYIGNRFRGYRPKWCNVGAINSQHRHGRAIDFNVIGYKSQEIRNDIIKNPFKYCYRYITGLENFKSMSWVHIDCRQWDKEQNGLLIFNNK